MIKLSAFLESFYKNVSHGDPLFKASMEFNEFINEYKKLIKDGGNLNDFRNKYIDFFNKMPECMSIICKLKGKIVDIFVRQDYNGCPLWRMFAVYPHKDPELLDDRILSKHLINQLYNFIKNGYEFDIDYEENIKL